MVFLEAKHTAYIDPIMQVLLNRQTILCHDEKHYLCFPQYCMTNSLAITASIPPFIHLIDILYNNLAAIRSVETNIIVQSQYVY